MRIIILAAGLALAGCGQGAQDAPEMSAPETTPAAVPTAQTSSELAVGPEVDDANIITGMWMPRTVDLGPPAVFNQLRPYCGQAYEGRGMSDDPQDAAWAADVRTLPFRECSDDEIRVPLHVGENRSRTWILTYEGWPGICPHFAPGPTQLNGQEVIMMDAQCWNRSVTLKHDHRHEDGSEDVLTMYGGTGTNFSTPGRMEFPADPYSRDLFQRENIPASMQNTWSITVTETSFTYELSRPERYFAAEFDLTRPVEAPPAPWGHE